MFKSARIKLTLLYLAIIMVVSALFSVSVYKLSTDELDKFSKMQQFRIERRFQIDRMILPPDMRMKLPTPIIDDELINEVKHKVALSLAAINILIFIVSGMLGYILSGLTLRPIKVMVDEQNRFISDASHELRTPLTALKSSLEVFLRDKNADLKGAKDLIQDSLKDIDTLSSLTTSLLELSQIQNKVDVQTASELHSSTVVNRAVSKVSPLALAKNITINSKSEETLFKGDETAIIEILIILLDNAIKYSPDNSLVNVSSYKKDGNVFFEVQDFGIGISEKDLPQIFNRFYRVNTSRSADKPSGFGLGLSIAQKLVTLCGGVITVKSELAKGSTFIVKLPTSHNLHI